MDLDRIFETIEQNRQKYIDELVEFLRIPSVSTYTDHARHVQESAQWLCDQFRKMGLYTQILPTERHPLVLAEYQRSPDLPTILVYGHYDVQPPEPLEEWRTPPFLPTISDGFIYARGASDDKGQLFTYVKAAEAFLAALGDIPINLKFLVEGEEEIGSPSLGTFLELNRDRLSADVVAISDGAQFAPGLPAITYGLRGLVYLQVDLQGPRFDLHSGAFGGLVTNPAQVLAEILAKLKDQDQRVNIPGFYDEVRELEAWEREQIQTLPFDEVDLKEYLGVDTLVGEPGYHPLERKMARPTLDINGIWGGFAGEGAKTIIPAKAGAKVSMRLVPDQKPERIKELFAGFLQSLTPPGIQLKITDLFCGEPVLVSRDHPSIGAAYRAIEQGFGHSPVFVREGGSIPIVNLIQHKLGIEQIVLMGWGRPDDGAHSPNERLFLDDFVCGIRSVAAFFNEMAGRSKIPLQ